MRWRRRVRLEARSPSCENGFIFTQRESQELVAGPPPSVMSVEAVASVSLLGSRDEAAKEEVVLDPISLSGCHGTQPDSDTMEM